MVSESSRYVDGRNFTPTVEYIRQNVPPETFARRFGYVFNTWVGLGYCPECITLVDSDTLADMSERVRAAYREVNVTHVLYQDLVYGLSWPWVWTMVVSSAALVVLGMVSVALESRLLAPDTLGYVSSVARNSRYIRLPRTAAGGFLSGSERARRLGDVEVMMQDVHADNPAVGKIALGTKTPAAKKLEIGRLYR